MLRALVVALQLASGGRACDQAPLKWASAKVSLSIVHVWLSNKSPAGESLHAGHGQKAHVSNGDAADVEHGFFPSVAAEG
jgi:hypothetical protein